MGLRTKANSFRCLYEKGLRKRAEFFALEKEENSPSLEDQIFKKDYNLQTVLEISKEIYRSLDPKELSNILLLTFMGQTRSGKGAFFLLEQGVYVCKINKGFADDSVAAFAWQSQQDITDLRDRKSSEAELILPLQGKNSIIAYVVLAQVGLVSISSEEEVLRPLLSLGGIALENAMLYDDIKERFKQLEALHEIGDTLTQSPDLQEVLFLAFAALEHGLGISKLLLFLKKGESFVVYDGYGCTEETHKRFSFTENSDIYPQICEPGVHDLSALELDWSQYLSSEEQKSSARLFIPLQTYGEVHGFLCILAKDQPQDAEWQLKLFELVGSYFSSALYLVLNKSYMDENEIDLSRVIEKLLGEQLEFSKKMNFPVLFALAQTKDAEQQALVEYLSSCHGKSIDLILGYKILIIPCEAASQVEEIIRKIEALRLELVRFVFSGEIETQQDLLKHLQI